MSEEWKVNPPYPHWSDYSEKLNEYAQSRLDDPAHKLPSDKSFLEWFKENEMLMRADPVIRNKNNVVAAQLLPLFEQEPTGWESITFINLVPPIPDKSLTQQLLDWQEACPPRLRGFAAKVSNVFG